MILASPKHLFSNQNSIEFSSFFHQPFLNIIFPTFHTSWCQNARFWDTLGAQRCPKWHPKWPKWRQNAQISGGAPKYCSRNRLDPKVAFGALLGIILLDLGWSFDKFWRILASVWLNSRQFWRQLCRPLKPHATYRKTENHREQADKCRNSANKQRTSDNEYNMLCFCRFRM